MSVQVLSPVHLNEPSSQVIATEYGSVPYDQYIRPLTTQEFEELIKDLGQIPVQVSLEEPSEILTFIQKWNRKEFLTSIYSQERPPNNRRTLLDLAVRTNSSKLIEFVYQRLEYCDDRLFNLIRVQTISIRSKEVQQLLLNYVQQLEEDEFYDECDDEIETILNNVQSIVFS